MAYAFVASANNASAGSATTITLSATYAAGENVVVPVFWLGADVVVTVADSAGSTYKQAGTNVFDSQSGGAGAALFYARNVSAGSRTITVTYATARTNLAVAYYRYTGLADIVGQVGAGSVAINSTAPTTGSMTPYSAPAMVFAATHTRFTTTSTLTQGSGFTSRGSISSFNALATDESMVEDKRITSGTGTPLAADFSASINTTTLTVGAIFSEPNASASGTPIVQSNSNFAEAAGTTIAVTLPSSVTSGNYLAVWVNSTDATCTLTDSLGNVVGTRKGTAIDNSIPQRLHQFFYPLTSGGSDTITATFGASVTLRSIAVVEVTGVTDLQDYKVGNSLSNSSASSLTVSATSIPTCVLSYFAALQGGLPTAGVAFTQAAAPFSLSGTNQSLAQYQNSSLGGVQTSSFGTPLGQHGTHAVMALGSTGSVTAVPYRGVHSKAAANVATTMTTIPVVTQTVRSTFMISVSDPNQNITVGDNKGNVYTQVGTTQTAGSTKLSVWKCENGIGGSGHTATVNWTSGTADGVVLFEEIVPTSVTAKVVVDVFNQTADASSPFSVTSPTLGTANQYVVALAAHDGTPTSYAEDTGFTLVESETNAALYWTQAALSKIVTATTALTPTFTSTGAGNVAMFVVCFKEADISPTSGGHGIGVEFVGTSSSGIVSSSFTSTSGNGIMLAAVGHGTGADSGLGVTDNKSNGAYTQLGSTHAYTAYPSSGTGVFYKTLPLGGASHTLTGVKPTGSSDEATVIGGQFLNVDTIVDSQWNEDTTGPTNDSLSVTTTGPATLCAFWWGDSASGELLPAVSSGWTLVEHSSSLASNHVQAAMAVRDVSAAGTYSITWTPSTSQGAQMYIVAMQLTGGVTTTTTVDANAPLIVQTKVGLGPGTSIAVATMNEQPVVGNHMIVVTNNGAAAGSTAADTLTDNQGHTYVKISTVGALSWWRTKITASSGAFTLTYTETATSGNTFIVHEVANVNPSLPIDGTGESYFQLAFSKSTLSYVAGHAAQVSDLALTAINLGSSGKDTVWLGTSAFVAGDTGGGIFLNLVTGKTPVTAAGPQTVSAGWTGGDSYQALGIVVRGLTQPSSILVGPKADFPPELLAEIQKSSESFYSLLDAKDWFYVELDTAKWFAPELTTAASGAVGTVSPGAGAIVISGNAPAVVQNVIIAVGTGSITVAGVAPAAVQSTIVSPAAAAVVIAGIAPTLLRGTVVQPGSGAATITGPPPTLIVGTVAQPGAGAIVLSGQVPANVVGTIVSPGVGSISVAGLAPTAQRGSVFAPAAGAITLTGLAPAAVVGTIATPASGAIVIAAQAPTATVGTVSSDTSISPGPASITLSGLAPVALRSSVFEPGAGAVSASGLAPSSVIGTILSPGAGAIGLAGLAPSLLLGTVVQPGAGAVTLSGLAPTILRGTVAAPGAGAISLSGQAPARITGTILSPGSGAITLTGLAPSTVTGSLFNPATGAITLAGLAPSLLIGSIFQPGAGAITISGQAPTATVSSATDTTRSPGAGAITLTGISPSILVNSIVQPGIGAVVVSGQAPSAVVGTIVSPGVGAISTNGQAPSLIRGSVAAPAAGSVTLTSQAPSAISGTIVSPAAGSIVLAGQAPTRVVGTVAAPGAGSVTLTGAAPSSVTGSLFSPTAATITLSGAAPSLLTDFRYAPGVGAITTSGQAPTAIAGAANAVAPGSITLAGQAPTVLVGTVVQPGAGAISVTGQAPSSITGVIVSPAAGSITVSGAAPTLSRGTVVEPGAGAVTLQGYAPILLLGSVAAPAAGAIAVSGLAPAAVVGTIISPAPGAVALAGVAPDIAVGREFSPDPGSLTLSGLAPTVSQQLYAQPGAGAVSVDGLAPVVRVDFRFEPDAGSASVSGAAPQPLQNALFEPGPGAIALAGQAPTSTNSAPASTRLSQKHAAWLEALARLHGLIDPLRVSETAREDGTVVQTVNDAGDTVTMTTTAKPDEGVDEDSALTAQQAGWLEALVRVHGLIDPLVVTSAGRSDGTLVQTISNDGVTTTVTRTS